MSLNLHIIGITTFSGVGSFDFTGNSTSMGDLTGTITGSTTANPLSVILGGNIIGTGSISGAFTGTISAFLDFNGNLIVDINITP